MTYPKVRECPYRDENKGKCEMCEQAVKHTHFTCWLTKEMCTFNTSSYDYAGCSRFKEASGYIYKM